MNVKHLDGLRGLAVLLVLLSHYSNVGYFPESINFSGVGKVGVYLFFVLSAYLLTLGALRKGPSFLTISGIRYYLFRRFMRIYPLYFIVVLVSVLTTEYFSEYLLGQGFPYKMDWETGFSHLAMIKGYYVLWSIPVEIKYYFFLPFLILLFNLFSKWVAITTLALMIVLSFSIFQYENNSLSLSSYFCVFLLGSLFAFLENAGKLPKIDLGYISIAVLILGILLLVPSFYCLVGFDLPSDIFHSYTILIGLFWVFIIYIASCSHELKYLLNLPILRELGRVSFSVYLLHIPAMQGVKLIFGVGGWQFLLTLILITLASYSSYYLIERRFM